MYLIFDTETTGLPKRWDAPLTDSDNWPRCIQIAWQIHDENGDLLDHDDYLIIPDDYTIPFDSEQIHGISTALAKDQGVDLVQVLEKFQKALNQSQFIIGHNVSFDRNIIGAEFIRTKKKNFLEDKLVIDTCTEETAHLCKLKGGRAGKFKLPTLSELYYYVFKEYFQEVHNAKADVEATSRVFLELLRQGKLHPESIENIKVKTADLTKRKTPFPLIGLVHENLKEASAELKKKLNLPSKSLTRNDFSKTLIAAPFVHLHNHSQFSILQATSHINQLIEATARNNMPAVAITDHANLMGVFHFIKAIKKYNIKKEEGKKIKPIIGCEFYVCEDHKDKSRRDDGYQIVFLAKNKAGYHNLAKLASIAYLDGFYYVPRIDRELVKQYKENLIVLTGNTKGELPSKILNIGNKQAEEALQWWHAEFRDDLYIEIMRHGEEGEDRANEVLIELSKKYEIPLIATNNTYYINKEEANAHDILLCVKEGEKQSTPIGKGRGFRYG